MKIITRNQINSISASASAINNDYAISFALDEYTQHRYIANAATTTIALTIDAGTNALFLSHYFAESINVVFKQSTTTIDTQNISQTFDETDIVFAENQSSLMPAIWFDVPSNCDNIEITMTNSTNRKQTVNEWAATGANSTGRFRDVSANNCSYQNFPQLQIGSIIDSIYQITQRNGDGTGVDDVVLSPTANSPITISTILMPVYCGIIRCGTVETYPNFRVGASSTLNDRSLKNETESGEYNYQNEQITESVAGSFQANQMQRELFMQTYKRIRAKPFAFKLFDFNASGSVQFGYFSENPSVTADSKLYNLHSISIRLNAL